MTLLEELRQRTIEKKSIKEYEEKNVEYLEECYQKYLNKVKYYADNGFSECLIDIDKKLCCSSYVMNKFKKEGLKISDISSYTIPNIHTISESFDQFKVSW